MRPRSPCPAECCSGLLLTSSPGGVAVLALAVGGIALRRVVLLPPVAVGQPGLDEGARRNSARAVIAAVLATELFVLAAQVILASGGWKNPEPLADLT